MLPLKATVFFTGTSNATMDTQILTTKEVLVQTTSIQSTVITAASEEYRAQCKLMLILSYTTNTFSEVRLDKDLNTLIIVSRWLASISPILLLVTLMYWG